MVLELVEDGDCEDDGLVQRSPMACRWFEGGFEDGDTVVFVLAMVEREDEMGDRAVFSWVPSPDFWLLAWIFMGKFRGKPSYHPKSCRQ